ncbi:unnamed protein product [Schistocephalus solidus]|uniref:DUF1907 domain-containing protein n=1 Tax=Schistocephalus solidus TaxID=70667 RepID=A0A183SZ17_SCHSO|nr:unnamed protein product [Schistocephalus solidus]
MLCVMIVYMGCEIPNYSTVCTDLWGLIVCGTCRLVMDLKLEHFHCYSENGAEAGHFYYDTQPETAHYRVYLAPAKSILRIDRAIK